MQPGEMWETLSRCGGYEAMRHEIARFDDLSLRLFLDTLPLGLPGRVAVDEMASRQERNMRLRWRPPRRV